MHKYKLKFCKFYNKQEFFWRKLSSLSSLICLYIIFTFAKMLLNSNSKHSNSWIHIIFVLALRIFVATKGSSALIKASCRYFCSMYFGGRETHLKRNCIIFYKINGIALLIILKIDFDLIFALIKKKKLIHYLKIELSTEIDHNFKFIT